MGEDEKELLQSALTDQVAAAVGFHEMYGAFHAAGFSKREALEFCLPAEGP